MSVRVKEPCVDEMSHLEQVLAREKLTLSHVRRLLLPSDPWQAVRGLWRDRKGRAIKSQQRLRKEWDRR